MTNPHEGLPMLAGLTVIGGFSKPLFFVSHYHTNDGSHPVRCRSGPQTINRNMVIEILDTGLLG